MSVCASFPRFVPPGLAALAAGVVVSACASAPTSGASSRAAVAAPVARSTSESAPALPEVLGLSLTTADLERSVAFFRGLDFVLDDRRELSGPALSALVGVPSATVRVARLHLGTERVELDEFAPRGRPVPDGARSNDETFQHMAIVVGDMDAAYRRLTDQGVATISPSPQTIPRSNPAAGGVRALYFRDPDRHALELIWFPDGKGNARWHAPHAGVFLGVDHSALAIADTDRGQRFYEGLGFRVAGHSLNFGPEQEALSGVPGARVRITSLSPRKGPAVEFLSYLAPGPGASAPTRAAANDVWHWEVTVAVPDLDAALARGEAAGGRRVSKDAVDVRALSLGYSRAALVTDVDGHSLRLVQR